MSTTSSVPKPVTSTPVAQIVARLQAAKSQAAMIAVLRAESRPKASKALASEVKAHVGVLGDHLRAGRAPDSIATALAMLFCDADHSIACLRREGTLRASRYDYKGALIGRVAKAALSVRDLLGASPDRVAYLESVEALSRIAGNVGILQQEMERIITTHRTVVLKTVFVMINSLLFHGWLKDPGASSLDGRHYSSEEYAEAASLILRTYASLFSIKDDSFNEVDAEAVGNNAAVYNRLLLAAIRVTKFKEAEFFIDGLPYRADLKGETVTISSIDPDVERALRLGYIQGQGQAMIRYASMQEAPAVSIRDLVERGFERGSFDKLLELVDEPVRRMRLRLPAVPQIFDDFFGTDDLLRDEMEMLLALDVDNFGMIDDLFFSITDDVTSMDIFKVQRYFNFISCAYQKRLTAVDDAHERGQLTLTSTLLILPRDALLAQLKLIFGDEAKCREITAMLRMDPNEPHLDLQYRPFVDIGQHYVIAPHVVAASNLVRNTIVANRLRQSAIGPRDRMVHAVSEALRSAGFEVTTDFDPKIAGRELELDVVARRDGSLFIFECKNAYHPVSVHEMRNSWDHIRKARVQLDTRRGILSDPANQKHLFKKLEWEADGKCIVYTGIVIANRAFHGASLNGHPIRQAHELINVVTSGRIVADEDSLSFWLGSDFQVDDLIAYLGTDSIAAGQLAALDPYVWSYAMGYRQLTFSSYVLDTVKLDRQLRAKFGPPIPGGRQQSSS